MKRILSLIVLLLGTAAFCSAQIRMIPKERIDSLSSSRTVWCADYLQFDALAIDAGTHPENGKPISINFHFVNKSGESIMISKLDSSCSCVNASISPSVIAPGKRGTIKVKYNQKTHVGVHPRQIFVYKKSGVSEEELAAVLEFSATIY